MIGKKLNLKNCHFGRLTALNIAHKRNNRVFWECICSCGNKKIVAAGSLTENKTRSCGCLKKEYMSKTMWKGHEEISGHYLARLRNNAKNRKIKYEITNEELWIKYLEQGKKCALSMEDIGFGRGEYEFLIKQTASLDRIDSKDHYHFDNIQWIHKDINEMKSDLSEEDFFYWINLIANPIRSFDNKTPISITQKHFNFRGHGNLSLDKYHKYKYGAKLRNLDFKISIEDCWNLFIQQSCKCAVTGIDIVLSTHKDKIENTASLDRIDNNTGYLINNIRWVHKTINRMRMDISDQRFKYISGLIFIYRNQKT